TEFARPARTAKVVATVQKEYADKLKRGEIQDSFWMHIDDLSAEMAAQVTFPSRTDLEDMRDAALWVAQNSDGAFTIQAESGDVYRNGSSSEDDRPIFNTKSVKVSNLDITNFVYSTQQHLRDTIHKQPALLKTMKDRYEESIKNTERGSAERAEMTLMINKFIKPTLFRIALSEGIEGVYSM
ncbi:MAG: hypothetical protein II349_07030, partial [Akkermansia sp.]|nr:hypothetical protein [Akkermansia sp.]